MRFFKLLRNNKYVHVTCVRFCTLMREMSLRMYTICWSKLAMWVSSMEPQLLAELSAIHNTLGQLCE